MVSSLLRIIPEYGEGLNKKRKRCDICSDRKEKEKGDTTEAVTGWKKKEYA